VRWDCTEQGLSSLFENCEISGGVDVHIHAAGSSVGGYSGGYSLDLRRVLATHVRSAS